MPNPSKIINHLKEILDGYPEVMAFVLVGSQARETIYMATPYSDMEAYIVVKDEEKEVFEARLPELIKPLGEIIFLYKNQWSGFSAVFEDLFRLELPVTKQSDLSSTFSRPKAQTVKVLIDKTNGELEKVLEERPEKIDLEELFNYRVTDFWYMAILTVQYFKKGELWNSRSAFHTLNSSLIKFLELNKDPDILLLETNKRIEEFLKDDLKILRKVSPAYDEAEIKQAILDMFEIFPKTAWEIAGKYGFKYPQELEDAVKPKLLEILG